MSPDGSGSVARALGVPRVLAPAGALPQAADRLDPDPTLGPDELRVRLEWLNVDASSYRQLATACGGDGEAIRSEVLRLVERRGKLHNPVTGSGGMLVGVVDEVGPESRHGVAPGQRVASLVSLTLTPLQIDDELRDWDGLSPQVPARGHAIVFGRSAVTVVPDDLPVELALGVFDVAGAPASVDRLVRRYRGDGAEPVVAVLGVAGKSGLLALAAARRAGAAATIAVVLDDAQEEGLVRAGVADAAVVQDARDALALADAVGAAGGPADVTAVCVDVPGCEHGAILATAEGGTVVFFSLATSFSAATLGAEAFGADVTLLIGNGYVPGHADFALTLVREGPATRQLFESLVLDAAATHQP